MRLFERFKNPTTKGQIAAQMAEDTIGEHEMARLGREQEPLDAHDMHRMQRLALLMVGPMKHAVIPIVERRWPDFARAHAALNAPEGHA